MKSSYVPLKSRSILTISGPDTETFLQGIISNDIKKVSADNSIYACILTPQGKFLFDLFISRLENNFLIDCQAGRKNELKKKLMMYKLRSNLTIEDVSDKYEVVALLGENVHKNISEKIPGRTIKFCKGIAYIDPRSEKMYARSVTERSDQYKSFEAKGFSAGNIEDYEILRTSLTIPDSEKELQSEKSFPLQNRLDELNAIDFNKGCYVGQEVTARSKHRGNIRRTLYTINSGTKNIPAVGTEIKAGEKNIGTILSGINNLGIAMIEKEEIQNPEGLAAGEVKLTLSL